MEKYKQEFIEFMVKSNVLKFGQFVTKSGRQTPFFINTGNYTTGEQLEKLGQFYAQTIKERIGTDIDVLFGPAYKIRGALNKILSLSEEEKSIGVIWFSAGNHAQGVLMHIH